METLLEQQRRIHEERERLEREMVDEILHKKQSVSALHKIDYDLRHWTQSRAASANIFVAL